MVLASSAGAAPITQQGSPSASSRLLGSFLLADRPLDHAIDRLPRVGISPTTEDLKCGAGATERVAPGIAGPLPERGPREGEA